MPTRRESDGLVDGVLVMPKIKARRTEVDRTGSYMEVLKGPGFKTVIKRQGVFEIPLNSEGEYKALVEAGVPVAKVYRTVYKQIEGTRISAAHIAQQNARDIQSHELVGFAPQIAKIIHIAMKNYLFMPDLKHSNLGVVERLERENRGQEVVVRDITQFIWPMGLKEERARERIAEQAIDVLHDSVKRDYGAGIANELKENVLKHLELLKKKAEV